MSEIQLTIQEIDQPANTPDPSNSWRRRLQNNHELNIDNAPEEEEEENKTKLPFDLYKNITLKLDNIDEEESLNLPGQPNYPLKLMAWPDLPELIQDWQDKLRVHCNRKYAYFYDNNMLSDEIYEMGKGLDKPDYFAHAIMCCIGHDSLVKCNSWRDIMGYYGAECVVNTDDGETTSIQVLIHNLNDTDKQCCCSQNMLNSFTVRARYPPKPHLKLRTLEVGCVCILKTSIKYVIDFVVEYNIGDLEKNEKCKNYFETNNGIPSNEILNMLEELLEEMKKWDPTKDVDIKDIDRKKGLKELNMTILKAQISGIKMAKQTEKTRKAQHKSLEDKIITAVNKSTIIKFLQPTLKSLNEKVMKKRKRNEITNKCWEKVTQEYINETTESSYDNITDELKNSGYPKKREEHIEKELEERFDEIIKQKAKERKIIEGKVRECIVHVGKRIRQYGEYKGKSINDIYNLDYKARQRLKWFTNKYHGNWIIGLKVYLVFQTAGMSQAYKLYNSLPKYVPS